MKTVTLTMDEANCKILMAALDSWHDYSSDVVLDKEFYNAKDIYELAKKSPDMVSKELADRNRATTRAISNLMNITRLRDAVAEQLNE